MDMHSIIVMIVDDNFMNIAVLESFCKKANVKYVSFQNSVDALKLADLTNLYAAFLDLNMPLMNGYELAMGISKSNPRIKLFAVTGDDRDSVKQRCLLSGFTDVIEKPISYE
jgi:CheY-like chemotaxis protein